MIYDSEYLDGDHAKARQVEELAADQFARHTSSQTSRRPRFQKENTNEDFFLEITRENFEASNNHYDD